MTAVAPTLESGSELGSRREVRTLRKNKSRAKNSKGGRQRDNGARRSREMETNDTI